MDEMTLLGVRLHPMSLERAVEQVLTWASRPEPVGYVCLTAAHSLMTCRQDLATRAAFAGSLANFTDGMPLVWIARKRGYRQAERVYAADLLNEVCRHSAENGMRHLFYGGAPSVAQRVADRLRGRFPGLQTVGALSPPFRRLTPAEDAAEVARINEAEADIVWVALGTGKQEPWMQDHQGRLQAPLMISVGAAFDFLAGSKPQAPRWMQRSGLEWLFRLASEPVRLWPRYAAYPLFVLLAARELLGFRQGAIDADD